MSYILPIQSSNSRVFNNTVLSIISWCLWYLGTRPPHSTCGTGVLRKREQTTFLPIFNYIIILSETKIDSFNRLQNLITRNNHQTWFDQNPHNYFHPQVPFSCCPSDLRAPLSLYAPWSTNTLLIFIHMESMSVSHCHYAWLADPPHYAWLDD